MLSFSSRECTNLPEKKEYGLKLTVFLLFKYYINEYNHLSVAMTYLINNQYWCIIRIVNLNMGYCSWHCRRKPLSTRSKPVILSLGCMLNLLGDLKISTPRSYYRITLTSQAGLTYQYFLKLPSWYQRWS